MKLKGIRTMNAYKVELLARRNELKKRLQHGDVTLVMRKKELCREIDRVDSALRLSKSATNRARIKQELSSINNVLSLIPKIKANAVEFKAPQTRAQKILSLLAKDKGQKLSVVVKRAQTLMPTITYYEVCTLLCGLRSQGHAVSNGRRGRFLWRHA